MEDTGQDGLSSPATPGAGKSKLDSLPKEDLIKFAKKQLMLIQKVKSRCTDLEKEIETLKSRPASEDTDVVQALTERLDAVLLEKAETQQQLVSLKKEYAKTKEDAKDATKKAAELQQDLQQSSDSFLKEIDVLKNELVQTGNSHKEDVDTIKIELQDALVKQKELTDRLGVQENQDAEMKRLKEQLQLIPQVYEDKISSLQKALEAATEEKNHEITKLRETQAASEQYSYEIQDLHQRILKLQNEHKDAELRLKHQLETSMIGWEQEKLLLQDLINQYVEKEKRWQEEMSENNKNKQEVEILQKKLAEYCNVQDVQNSSLQSDNGKVEQLKSLVAELESQQSLLRDELTYINHLKISLEKEVQHLKSDYFHEREELEFKINELQLGIEEYNGLIEKLKTELQYSKMDYDQLARKKNEDIQAIRDQQKKEMFELEQAIVSRFEKERLSFVHEIELLKEQCDKAQQEREEAVSSYEGLRETFVSLQVELGESAGKISREFEMMKQQQATDVHELQQKLRTAYKDKNDVLETVNLLQGEIELLSSKQNEYEELNLKIIQLQQKNKELKVSLHQKDELINDMQLKVATEKSSTVSEEIQELQEMCKTEQARVLTLQHEADGQVMHNAQLKQTIEVLTQKLQDSIELSKQSEHEALQFKIKELQQKNEEVLIALHEKEAFLTVLQVKIADTTMENAEISCSLERSSEEMQKVQELCRTESEGHAKFIVQLEQTIMDLTHNLEESVTIRDQSLNEVKNLQQQVDMLILDKQNLQNDSRKWHDEVSRVHEEKDILSRDFDRLVSEHNGCLAAKEELSELRMKLQLVAEGKDEVASLLETKERNIEELKIQLYVLLDILAVQCTGQDLITVLQDINKAVLQLKEEKQNVMLQREETSVELEGLQEEFEIQCSELRALLSDYSKEKSLLKEELEETLRDKEALQSDLLEMKNTLEKSKLDNQDLLSRIENVTLELNALQVEKTNVIESNKQAQEGLQSVTENKALAFDAVTLELQSAQDLLSKSKTLELEQQNLISDLQKKIENLERECKEKEEKSNKIKGVAVKAKKELDANKKQVQSVREELERVKAEKDQLMSSTKDLVQGAESYQNLLLEYDKQVEFLEVEKELVRSTGRQLEELSQQLQASTLEQERMNSANEDLVTHMETLQSNNKLIEAQLLELQRAKVSLEKDLEAEKLIKEQKIKDLNCAIKQIEELQEQLQKEKKHLQKTTEELGLVRKDAQKSTMMDMEIDDYDRLVKELNKSIIHKNSQLEDLEQEIHVQNQKLEVMQEEISLLQTTVEQHEERSRKMKQLLIKTKKELADSKQAESDHLILQASLKGELEASQQHVEAYKIQVAELTSEKHKVQEQLRTLTEQHQRAGNAYQQKLLALQEECTAAKAEQAAVTAEFESYKVRVHNVLKQQKNKSASQAEQEAFKQEREHLQTMLDQLKTKLLETQHSLQLNVAELQALQSEHDMLLERHNKMLQETVTKEAELREKLCMVQSENMVLKTENEQAVSQLSAQNEAQRNSFRDQVRQLQDGHRKTVETLQQQLSKVEAQLFQLKNEITVTNNSGTQQPPKGTRDRRPADLSILDLYSVAREEGEGMETMDNESVSSASTHVATLEQLLNSPDSKTVLESPQWQPELSKEELVEKLNTTSKSVDHLSGLLHETEATNAMLMEQITLLKNEIRRLERNQEREKSVANLEYLKNVLLQFIFLKAGSERQRLLPVIDTMLQLSPEEKGKLFAIAQGEEESAAQPAGWASYLHSWSGLR
ncbi:GRIP and coiled-coil domain-containing protein 2 isoform X2 [Pseudophryne corroboree]|uniref:GRIP and coiled-coil domain-containing protein 2 isoform X2 n=1 Tax=Pseudophryne corroboree TaxID=495146 RepID=UPI0030818E6F